MAWFLQGLEAAFVHSITVIGPEFGYRVFANEHDGAVVDGTIPEDAIAKARQRSGFTNAEFVEKPFASDKEVNEVYGNRDFQPSNCAEAS
jgi:hypothetical protein